MIELKIDDELRDLLPPLSIDEKEQLERNLLSNGYIGSPIYTWNGYIVDGHNRYEICKKHNIEFKFEELFTMEVSKTDVMEWMINTQLGRRNLIPAQRILIVQKFRDRVKEEARIRQRVAGEEFGNGKSSSSPKGEKLNVKKVHTEKELAKMARVGYGTQARFDQVMKYGDEDLKQKVLTGEMKITPAYDILKAKKDDIKRQEVIKGIIDEVKSEKNVDEYWNVYDEIECIKESFQQPIEFTLEILFGVNGINEKITTEESYAVLECLDSVICNINKIKNKIKKY